MGGFPCFRLPRWAETNTTIYTLTHEIGLVKSGLSKRRGCVLESTNCGDCLEASQKQTAQSLGSPPNLKNPCCRRRHLKAGSSRNSCLCPNKGKGAVQPGSQQDLDPGGGKCKRHFQVLIKGDVSPKVKHLPWMDGIPAAGDE